MLVSWVMASPLVIVHVYLTYRPPCRRFRVRQTDDPDYEGKPRTFSRQVSQFLSGFIPLTTLCLGPTWFMLECRNLSAQQEALKPPTSPALSDAPTHRFGCSYRRRPTPYLRIGMVSLSTLLNFFTARISSRIPSRLLSLGPD